MTDSREQLDLNTADLRILQPDPLQPSPDEVEHYVVALQAACSKESANSDWIKREVWRQLQLATYRTRHDLGEASETFNWIFYLGQTPENTVGFKPGMFCAVVGLGIANGSIQRLLQRWPVWQGKVWEPNGLRGYNILKRKYSAPIRTLWHGHKFEPLGREELLGLHFHTYLGPGFTDEGKEVLIVQYRGDENPWFQTRMLDEIVEVVPDIYLGKVITKVGSRYREILYFANRSEELGL